jgi:hypothetical protein
MNRQIHPNDAERVELLVDAHGGSLFNSREAQMPGDDAPGSVT